MSLFVPGGSCAACSSRGQSQRIGQEKHIRGAHSCHGRPSLATQTFLSVSVGNYPLKDARERSELILYFPLFVLHDFWCLWTQLEACCEDSGTQVDTWETSPGASGVFVTKRETNNFCQRFWQRFKVNLKSSWFEVDSDFLPAKYCLTERFCSICGSKHFIWTCVDVTTPPGRFSLG